LNNYTSSRRNGRIFLIYNSIGYLTNTIDYNKPIRLNEILYIQTQSNINKMYELIKKNEINNAPIKPPKITTAKGKNIGKNIEKNIEKEKMLDKLNIFNDLQI